MFSREEISADVVMASAALPLLFQAVEIEGVPYWDGGYGANPALLPLVRPTAAHGCAGDADQSIDAPGKARAPRRTSSTGSTKSRSMHRSTAELRTLSTIARLIDQGRLKPGRAIVAVNLHRITLESGPRITPESRLNTEYRFLELLHRAGRRAARRFLDAHFDDIGMRGTLSP